MSKRITRREFLSGASAFGAVSLLGMDGALAEDEPPEITTVRMADWSASCTAPQYVAEAMLRAEGFTDVQYVRPTLPPADDSLIGHPGHGEADFDMSPGEWMMLHLDVGAPIRVLAGVHLGCYELFGNEVVRSIRDLSGKKVAIIAYGQTKHALLSSMVSYVGLDPTRDINWVVIPSSADAMESFIRGEVDAFLGFPPEPQILRSRGIRNVIVNTSTDKPWSQYYCCMLFSTHEFVSRYPVATKRVVRAIIKAVDLCSKDPAWVAREMVNNGYVENYDYALEALRGVRYNVWRTYDPDDTLRFHGLRLHDVGMIKTPPNDLIAKGTDWRFLNELKKELKA